jgi:hypothetical protein
VWQQEAGQNVRGLDMAIHFNYLAYFFPIWLVEYVKKNIIIVHLNAQFVLAFR